MSSDDGDNFFGSFGEDYIRWHQGEEEVYNWKNEEAPQGWLDWGHSDVEGSHWSWEFGEQVGNQEWETIYFDTFQEAMAQSEAIRDNPSEFIEGHIGNIGEISIIHNPETDMYYVEVDAYVEY